MVKSRGSLAAVVTLLLLAPAAAHALPDLVTQNLGVSPSSGAVGSSFTVSFTVRNQGNTTAQASTTNVRMAVSSSTVTSSDPLLVSVSVPALAAGGTHNVSRSVTVPSGRPSGSNFVWVILDVSSSAGQGAANEGNDKTNKLFTVTGLPDLITQNLSVSPSSGAVGSSFTVSFTIRNQGSGTAQSSTTNVRMAVSSSSVTTSDPLLFNVNVPSLSAGSTHNVNQSVTVPSGRPSGSNHVWVILDVNSSAGQGSANEGNDKTNKLFTVTGLPDLITQNLSVSPSSGAVGSSFTVSFTIRNQGSGTAQSSTTNVRMAVSSSSVTSSDPMLFSVNVPSLSAGSTHNVSQSVTVPSGRPSGSNHVWVILDVNSSAGQGSANEGNDKTNKLFTVTGLPDLITQNLSVSPSSGAVGSSFTVSFAIRNQGSGTAQSSTTNVRMAVSSSSVTSSDPLLFSVNVPALSAGSTHNVSQSVTVPSGRPSGSNHVWVILDVNSSAGQGSANEGNDKTNKLFTVTGLPDLVTQNFSLTPSSGAVGSSFTVSFTIRNQGGGTAQSSTANVRMAVSSSSVTTSDPLLFSVNVPALSAGSTHNVSQSVTVPSGRPLGSNFVWVILDVNSSAGQGAANEGNDRTNTLFTVSVPSLPDLITQNLNLNPPSGTVGSSFTVSFTIRNQGSAQAQASVTNVRMAVSSSSVTTSDPLLFSVNVPALSAGSTHNVSQSVTVPSGRPSGSNYVWVILDANSSAGQGAANEGNDRTNTLFTVNGSGLPDLVPQSITVNPASLAVGESAAVSFTVRNQGGGSAIPTTTRLRLSTSAGGPSLSDPILGDVNTPSLAAGASIAQSAQVTIPSGTSSGSYHVWVIVDNFSKLQQTSAANDFGSKSINVTGPAAPPGELPDFFEFSSISSPQQLGTGFNITVRARATGGSLVPFTGSVTLSANIGTVRPSSFQLNSGTGTASVTLDTAGSGVRLNASGAGATGTSNSFNVTTTAPATGRLSGVITLQSSGAVVAGATVELTGTQGTTITFSGPDGRFAFPNAASGEYTVMAHHTATGYRSTAYKLQVVANGLRWKPIVLSDCNPSGVTPVLLVPGILGSSLPEGLLTPRLPKDVPAWNDSRWGEWGGSNPGGLFEVLWYPGWRDFVFSLRLANSKYKVGCTIFPVPYDWRLPVKAVAEKYLVHAIAHAKEVAGTTKVSIVAHSMGGLVTRAYIQGDSYQNDIKRFAMVGTPNHGAPFAYYLWQGSDPENPALPSYLSALEGVADTLEYPKLHVCLPSDTAGSTIPKADDCYVDRQRVYNLLHNDVRSVKDLLPTGTKALDPNGALSCDPEEEWTNDWLTGLNASSSLSLLDGITHLYAGVTDKFFQGTKSTLDTLAVESRDCSRDFYPDGVPKANQTKGKGDETVPLSSLSLPGFNIAATRDADHKSLIFAHRFDLVELISEGEPGTNLSALSPESETGSAQGRELAVSILGRAQLYLRAPDQTASGIAPDSGIEAIGIPGSHIAVRPDATTVIVPDPVDGTYQVTLSGIHEEDYLLRLVYLDDLGNSTEIEGIGFFTGPDTLTFDLEAGGNPTLSLRNRPPRPTGVRANRLAAETQVSWSASADPQVVGYNVYSRLATMPTFAFVATTAGTSVDTSDPWAGDESVEMHIYAVSAVYPDGSESFLSEQVENNDRDHDGLTDSREADLGTGVDDPDSDDDGLVDGDEFARGTNPLEADSDHDGYSDSDEIARGSDPLSASSTPGLDFFTVTPCRLVDTRSGSALLSGVEQTFVLTGSCGIPAAARALSVNMTVAGATGQGSVTLLPARTLNVTTSGISFGAGQTRGNNGIVQLAPDGSGSVFAQASVSGGGEVHFILDVNGYFAETHPMIGKWRGTVGGTPDLLIGQNEGTFTALLSGDGTNDPLEQLEVVSISATEAVIHRPADVADYELSLVQSGLQQCLDGDYVEDGTRRPTTLCRTSVSPDLADDFEAGDFSAYLVSKFGSDQNSVAWGFVQDGGSMVLEGSGGGSSGGGDSVAYLKRVDPELNDALISVRLKVQEVRNAGHHSGIAARFTATTRQFYELWVNASSDLLILSRRNGTQEVRLASIPLPSNLLDDWITLEFEVIGDRLRGRVNGQTLIEVNDSVLAVGGVGFSNAAGVTRYDDFRVEAETSGAQ